MAARAVGAVPSLVAVTSLAPGVKLVKAAALVRPAWPKTLWSSAITVPRWMAISCPLPLTMLREMVISASAEYRWVMPLPNWL